MIRHEDVHLAVLEEEDGGGGQGDVGTVKREVVELKVVDV